MKLNFFSDTHNKHQKVVFSDADVLVFCGDMSARGKLSDVEKFANFLLQLPHRYKIVIAGNHDFCFENDQAEQAEVMIRQAGAIYLNDSGVVINDVKFWGSPVQPFFHNWAFNRHRGAEIKQHWDLIPDDTQILITHGPPSGILDRIYMGEHVGCADLLEKVKSIRPTIHAFGHIHEDYGVEQHGPTTFINACSVDLQLKVVRPAISYDYSR